MYALQLYLFTALLFYIILTSSFMSMKDMLEEDFDKYPFLVFSAMVVSSLLWPILLCMMLFSNPRE